MVELIACLAVYFAPTIIASCRRHKNEIAIAMFNLFLGWTVIGWLVAVIWSCTNNFRRTAVN
jgi:hypothetical protein